MKLNPLITVFLFGLYASVTLNAQTPQNPTNPFPNKKTNPPTSQPPRQHPSQTVPPVKDTFNACFKLVRAACVVRTFAFVATFIPI